MLNLRSNLSGNVGCEREQHDKWMFHTRKAAYRIPMVPLAQKMERTRRSLLNIYVALLFQTFHLESSHK
ncbi:CLUMA_CG000969, isoform A [Clunio marinus]|uniref:CLUMA_CG000969, isoform A n=1 Tax=Clunio marinus TaxID=568069 RepID=A0A1J1HLQ2_9DIPT|nr:CLUMA_CG000969, isoform A [Clunio marinus]